MIVHSKCKLFVDKVKVDSEQLLKELFVNLDSQFSTILTKNVIWKSKNDLRFTHLEFKEV